MHLQSTGFSSFWQFVQHFCMIPFSVSLDFYTLIIPPRALPFLKLQSHPQSRYFQGFFSKGLTAAHPPNSHKYDISAALLSALWTSGYNHSGGSSCFSRRVCGRIFLGYIFLFINLYPQVYVRKSAGDRSYCLLLILIYGCHCTHIVVSQIHDSLEKRSSSFRLIRQSLPTRNAFSFPLLISR